MPFTLLSHQAPVLPLKLWRPRLFCGTALVLGSMAPDLEYFLEARPVPVDGHTLAGQLLFCLPLTFVLVLLVRAVAARIAAHLPDLGVFHARDYGLISRSRMDARDVVRVVTSALVGSFSHVFVDGFTHRTGFAVTRLSPLRAPLLHVGAKAVPVYRALQLGGSVALALIALALLARIGRDRRMLAFYGVSAAAVPAPARHHALFYSVTVAVGIALGILQAVLTLPLYDDSVVVYVGTVVLEVGCSLFVGACLAVAIEKALAARRDRAPAAPVDAATE